LAAISARRGSSSSSQSRLMTLRAAVCWTAKPIEGPVEHQEEQLVLAAHVVIEAGEGEPGRARDVADRRLMEAAPRDGLARRREDPVVSLAERHPEPPADHPFG
jgi:hypothetical protein